MIHLASSVAYRRQHLSASNNAEADGKEMRKIDGCEATVTAVLGVDFWSGFGPVSAMKTGLFGPGNRTKSPVSAVKSGLFGPGNRTKSPVFQCDFGEKAENNQEKSSFSRREIELFEEVSEEVSG